MSGQISGNGSRLSDEAEALVALYREELALYRAPGAVRLTPAEERSQFEEAMAQLGAAPDDAEVELAELAGIGAEWISVPASSADRIVLYLHGGGYVLGSPAAYREFASRLARAARARVAVLDYRLAPEHTFPAALDDAANAYAALLLAGAEPRHIVIAGDSAGGGLAVACLVQIRDAGLELPAGAVCLSPWVDLSMDHPRTGKEEDLAPEQLVGWAGLYLAGTDARDPRASPVYAQLEGLPPTLVHVGGAETLLDDAVRLVDELTNAGSTASLEIFEELVHIFQVVPGIPETEESIEQIGTFILERTG